MRVVQVGLRVLAFPEMDLAALGLSAWVVPRYPSASLGQYDCLVARRFALCVPACLCLYVCMCTCGPCSPGIPLSPLSPFSPIVPFCPTSPFIPFSPCSPGLPTSPCSPSGP